MTTAHVEKFAELVAKDPALQAKLGLDKVNADAAAAAASVAAFITTALKRQKLSVWNSMRMKRRLILQQQPMQH